MRHGRKGMVLTLNNSKYIGVDLGTANTLVYVKNKGITVREPSVVVFDRNTSKILATGTEAKNMVGKTPANLSSLYPLRGGVIADFEFCAEMLYGFLKKNMNTLTGLRPKVIVCVPYGITEVEKRAVMDSALEAGAGSVYTFDEPICAALGAGLPVMSGRGSMIVDIGAGTTEIAVLSHGGIVTSSSVKTAGNTLDNALVSYIKQEFNVLIGESGAEEIKIKIGSAHKSTDIGAIQVKGRNMRTGKAAEFTLYSAEVREAISETLASLFESIRSVLDSTPPELCADIYDSGMTLCGGGALLRGLSAYISEKSRLPVKVAENAPDCVINGIGKLIANSEMRHRIESIVLHSDI